MKRITGIITLLLAALTIVLLAGCTAARSYSSVTTHVDQRVTEDDPSVLRAETYQELVSSILHFVSEGDETGTVRLYQYTGDVESDLKAACQEVLEQDPLGAYALTDLEHAYSRIVSYYECDFTFTYRRTAAEISNISTAASTVSFREQLQQTMDSFGESLAVRTSLSLTRERIQEMVTEYYYETPILALGFPTVTVSFYGGEDSEQKIIEVEFYYVQDSAACQVMQEELLAAANALLDGLGAEGDRASLWSIYETLSGYSIYSSLNSSSAYRFLTKQGGARQGAALSLLLLCDLLELDAYYVEGTTAEGGDTCWVIVQVGDVWCHMDLTLADDEAGFLHSDDEMLALGYTWDQAAYPACAGLALETAEAEPQEGGEDETEDSETAGDGLLQLTVPEV